MSVKATKLIGHLVVDLNDRDAAAPVKAANHGSINPVDAGPQSILVPVDFNDCSKKALLYANHFAGQSNSRILLLHVLPARYGQMWKYNAVLGEWSPDNNWRFLVERSLARLARDYIAPGVTVEIEVRFGSSADQIAEAARERNINLIIMGTHGYQGLLRALIGSVSGAVTKQAPCPVLVVRERELEFSLKNNRSVGNPTPPAPATSD